MDLSLTAIVTNNPNESMSFFLLAAATVSLWLLEGKAIWTLFLLAATAWGIHFGALEPEAGIFVALYWFICLFSFATLRPRIRMIARIFLVVFTFGLVLHLFRGFPPWVIVAHLQLEQRLIPFTHFVSFDHAMMGLMILGMGAVPLARKRTDWNVLVRETWPIAITALVAVSCVAYANHYVDMEFAWSPYFKIWAVADLFFVVIAEEAIFRGIIQKPLSDILRGWRTSGIQIGAWVALFITTGVYVLRHFYAGPMVMIFSGVSGLFAGYAFQRTQRIEAAIIVHFAIDAVHFLSFTYPLLV